MTLQASTALGYPKNWMESLYARDTPTAHERKLKLAERGQVIPYDQVVQEGLQSTVTFDGPTEFASTADSSGAVSTSNATTNSTGDGFRFNVASLPRVELQQPLTQTISQPNQEILREPNKMEEGRLAEFSEDAISLRSVLPVLKAEKFETRTPENPQQNQQRTASDTTLQSRRYRRPKPAITINTGLGSAAVGAKRPPPTPVTPPMFSWSDILCAQNLIERCLQQYLSKNDILIILKEQASVDRGFANVVWQKLEEQNPAFFRAYSLQLQLKEQIIAFNYLVKQQKEMTANGSKRVLHYSNLNQSSASRASGQSFLVAAPTSTALPPISTDPRTLLRTPICPAKQHCTPTEKRPYNQHQHKNTYQLACSSVDLGAASSGLTTLPPPSPLPLPSPIKTDLDTHAFFT